MISGSIARGNGFDGFRGASGVIYRDNVASNNIGAGIYTGEDCNVQGSVTTGNSQQGIYLSEGCGFGGNVSNGNNDDNEQIWLPPSGAAVELSTNVCGGDAVCP